MKQNGDPAAHLQQEQNNTYPERQNRGERGFVVQLLPPDRPRNSMSPKNSGSLGLDKVRLFSEDRVGQNYSGVLSFGFVSGVVSVLGQARLIPLTKLSFLIMRPFRQSFSVSCFFR